MIYEILSIEPGENPNDVLVRVGYWFRARSTRVKRKPETADFVEDHLISGIPEVLGEPVVVGASYMMKDGTTINAWEEVDGQWQRVDHTHPAIRDQIQRHPVSEEERLSYILEPIAARAAQVDVDRPQSGEDLFPEWARPQERIKTPGALARVPSVADLANSQRAI